jgi:hypothetical protein
MGQEHTRTSDSVANLQWKFQPSRSLRVDVTLSSKHTTITKQRDQLAVETTERWGLIWNPLHRDRTGNWSVAVRVDGAKRSVSFRDDILPVAGEKRQNLKTDPPDSQICDRGTEVRLLISPDLKVKTDPNSTTGKTSLGGNIDDTIRHVVERVLEGTPSHPVRNGDTWVIRKDWGVNPTPECILVSEYRYAGIRNGLHRINVVGSLEHKPQQATEAETRLPRYESRPISLKRLVGSIDFDQAKGHLDNSEVTWLIEGREVELSKAGVGGTIDWSFRHSVVINVKDKTD